MKYNFENIVSVIEGTIVQQSANGEIQHLLLDSRKLIFPDTSIFFALSGGRRDGHRFIPDLYKKGVRNFVVSNDVDGSLYPHANIVRVNETLLALQQLTAHHRQLFSLPVIGITGSNGKTIVKEWLNQVLSGRFNIARSPKSYNSQIGVPLSVWPLNEHHELAIFEAGISQVDEMARLEKIIQPTIGLFTNIGAAHSEGFPDKRAKIREKLLLFEHVSTLIYCKDYQELHEELSSFLVNRKNIHHIKIIDWSFHQPAAVSIGHIDKQDRSTHITAIFDSAPISIAIPFTDNASIENAIHCLCVLLHFNVPSDEIKQKMLSLGTVAMRLELKEGINSCSIINDSYSADLSSLEIALDFLAQQQQHAKRTVILTDILETGMSESDLYSRISKSLEHRNISRLIGIGSSISRHQFAFNNASLNERNFFDSIESFREHFAHLHFGHETILIKGARVFELEDISRMLEQKVHETVLEIDLNALVHNLKQYQHLISSSTKIMAMVKAFSYGSGSYEIANVLQFHNIDYLAVAYVDEGIDLRKGGITLPIMVMNVDESAFDALIKYNLEPEIYSLSLLRSFNEYLKHEGISSFPVHIEIETGMNRLGFHKSEIPELLELLRARTLTVKSIFTHLVASEDAQHDTFTAQQAQLFFEIRSELRMALDYPFLSHIANSSGISRHPELRLDMVRLGIGLYGISDDRSLGLKEVSTLKSTIAQIKNIKEGETVGYGRKGVATRESKIATVRIGYADGYPRSLSNGVGKMWVNGHLAPVIGTVCMDMTMIDITDIPDTKEGDGVIVFGTQLPVSQVAHWAGTIPYEILTGVSQRVKRVYFEE